MPKPTFLNLPAEKRERIVEAAIDEFAAHPFREASVAGLVARAGIPRGSFYQYFTDMKDVYMYLMEIVAEQKIRYVNAAVAREKGSGFFNRMRSLYAGSLSYAMENPKLAAIGFFLMKDDIRFRQEIMESMADKTHDFFAEVFEQAQAAGEIRPDIDIAMVSFLFSGLNMGMLDYYLLSHQFSDILDDNRGYLELVNKMLKIIEQGIAARD